MSDETVRLLFDGNEAAMRIVEAMYGKHRAPGETPDAVFAQLGEQVSSNLTIAVEMIVAYIGWASAQNIPGDPDEMALIILGAVLGKKLRPRTIDGKLITPTQVLDSLPGPMPGRARRAASAVFAYVAELLVAADRAPPPSSPTKH